MPASKSPYLALTVVAPVRDGMRWAGPLVSCLARQGLGASEWELLVVDDGSSDGSGDAFLAAAAELLPGVAARCVATPPRGLGAARNLGMREARGEWVYFVDCDDELAGGALAELLARCRRDDLDLLLFGGEPVYETPALEAALPQYRPLLERRLDPDKVYSGRDALVAMAEWAGFCPCAWLMVSRRPAALAGGARFAEGVLNEDNLFAVTMALASRRVGCDPAGRYRYSVREGSLQGANRSGEARLVAHLELLRECESLRAGALSEGDGGLAAAIESVSSWFAEVAVREAGSAGGMLLEERFLPLRAAARMASTAAAERERAERAEAEAATLRAELDALRSSRRWRLAGALARPLEAARRLAAGR